MEASNELNDIILNKHPKNDKTKKILLTIATFSIVLIIVVIAMNQFTNRENTALPHLPETASKVTEEKLVREPVFEIVEESAVEAETQTQQQTAVAVEEPAEAKTVVAAEEPKEELEVTVFEEPGVIKEPVYEETIEPAAKDVPVKPAAKPAAPKVEKTVTKPKVARPSGKYDPRTKRVVGAETLPKAVAGQYYIQVGSFARYAPSKAFLDNITDRGYTYTFHQVTKNGKTSTKVLIGPFKTQTSARQALPVIKKRIVQGAFLIKL
jgi:DedD protein